MQRAREIGVRMRSGGSRTVELDNDEIEDRKSVV
jgi:hypothetical protein